MIDKSLILIDYVNKKGFVKFIAGVTDKFYIKITIAGKKSRITIIYNRVWRDIDAWDFAQYYTIPPGLRILIFEYITNPQGFNERDVLNKILEYIKDLDREFYEYAKDLI